MSRGSVKAVKLREKRNRSPRGEPFVWLTREMLESEAWLSLPLASLHVIFRIILEHMGHAGTENGNLIVTYDDFAKFGIRRMSINAAIARAVVSGFIIITVKGRACVGLDRWPTKYALGWLPLKDGTPAPNRWKAWRASPRPHEDINSSSENATGEVDANPPFASSENATGKVAETMKPQ